MNQDFHRCKGTSCECVVRADRILRVGAYTLALTYVAALACWLL